MRVVTLQTSRVSEVIPEGFAGREEITAGFAELTMLGRAATLEDVANVAAFAASDRASMITGTAINITGGAGRSEPERQEDVLGRISKLCSYIVG